MERRRRRTSVFAVDPRSAARSVYGFVLYVAASLGLGVYLVWAFVPDQWLHAVGITYYPQRYWAVAIPAYLCVLWVAIFCVFSAVTMLGTPPFDSIDAFRDVHSYPVHPAAHPNGIPPLGDMDICEVNARLYDFDRRRVPTRHSKMDLIDIGANLAHRTFSHNLDALLASARAVGVRRIVATGTSLPNSRAVIALARRFPGTVFATCGVHPHDAKSLNAALLSELERVAQSPEVVAVGECGLDFDRDFSPRDVQERVFEEQLRIASRVRKPVFLHERKAHSKFCEVLSRFPQGALPPCVVHCFTGTEQELDRYLAMGMYIGITGWVCDERRGRELQGIVKKIPLDRIMIETDAPFLVPRTIRPRPNHCEPQHLPAVLQTLAQCMGVEAAELATHTTRNAERFFALPAPSAP